MIGSVLVGKLEIRWNGASRFFGLGLRWVVGGGEWNDACSDLRARRTSAVSWKAMTFDLPVLMRSRDFSLHV
jgi:hypothetical protein